MDSILSDVATVTLTIAPVNDAPVAIDDAISTAEDVPVVGNVVLNDLDIDGGALAVMSVTQGASGVVTFAGGTVTYTPNANFSGADSFTYIVSDGAGGTSMATVTVTVSSVNDAPALGNDAATVAEDSFVSIDVLANDSDIDGGTLSIVSTSVPTSGTATIVNGQVVYTPGPNYNGGDSFTYTASDGQGGQAVATVTIGVTPVNDAPVGVDDAYSTEFLETFTRTAANGVLANDTDIDSTLTAALVNPPVAGSLTLNPDGSFVYTPQDPCPRTDSFTYVATDGVLNSQIVTVIFTINHPPSATNDSYTFGFGGTTSTWTVPGLDANLFTTTTVILQYGNFGRDYDQDNDVLQASIVVGPSNALSFTFNPDGSFTYQPASALNDSFVYSISDGSKT